MLGVLAALAACGEAPTSPRYREPVAEVAGLTLDASVVAMIAERDGLDADAARERGLGTLRLATSYQETRRRESAEVVLIDPTREAHLLRSARARRWLAEDFEAKHRPADIPNPLIEQNLGKKSLFHPEVHALCNAIVMPIEVDEESGLHVLPLDDPQWWARAEQYMLPISQRLTRYIPNPGTEPGCDFFGRVARMAAPESDEFFLKIEQGGFAVCAENLWDPGFVGALCGKVDAPGWVDPFRTRFGVHQIAVVHIDPANEPDEAEKKAYLRERMHPTWQKQAFAEYMQRLRAKRTVRLSAGLRGTDSPASPGDVP